jgi:hypothetical protein
MINGILFDFTRAELQEHFVKVALHYRKQLERAEAIAAEKLTPEQQRCVNRGIALLIKTTEAWAQYGEHIADPEAEASPGIAKVFRLTARDLESIDYPLSRLTLDTLGDVEFRAALTGDMVGVGSGAIRGSNEAVGIVGVN